MALIADEKYSITDVVADSRPDGVDSGPNGGGSLQLPDPQVASSSGNQWLLQRTHVVEYEG